MAMIFPPDSKVILGQTELEGQVVLLDKDSWTMYAPNKKKNWFRFGIDAALPLLGISKIPSKTDIQWLSEAKIYVLPEGSLELEDESEETPKT